MTPRAVARAFRLDAAKRALEAAIGRGDARLIEFATASPERLQPPDAEANRLIGANMRRRAWLRVLRAKMTGSAVSEAVAGEVYQRVVRAYPKPPPPDPYYFALARVVSATPPASGCELAATPPASGAPRSADFAAGAPGAAEDDQDDR